jgi:hypothetical protein
MRGVARIVALAIVIGPVALGCSENGKQDCIVVVDQTIDVQTTWTSGCVYLIQGWDLYLTAPLTIEPGVVVKFDRDRGPDLVLGENGTIIAQGTVTKPIIFTSWRDDENGGSTSTLTMARCSRTAAFTMAGAARTCQR